MGFSEQQTKALSAKLHSKHVKQRTKNGVTLSYIEGWHGIAEANRIFGFDAWDRETVDSRCVWENAHARSNACAYTSRVRISVRAGDEVIRREGSGFGKGFGSTLGDAHELAIKEAETDAMKRALSTFGNPFGLALYDREQKGVRGAKANGSKWQGTIVDEIGVTTDTFDQPSRFYTHMKMRLEAFAKLASLEAFWSANQGLVIQLKDQQPNLLDDSGRHYSDILAEIYDKKWRALQSNGRGSKHPTQAEIQVEKPPTAKFLKANSRPPAPIRDKSHLKHVASQSCLICGRNPSQAHHVKIAEPRAMGRKVGDQWTVPLCGYHHRELHDAGNEGAWWERNNLDPIGEARKLWQQGA